MILKKTTLRKLNRIIGFIVSTLMLTGGILTLMEGKQTYSNYWGGKVFAPVAIFLGCVGFYLSIFKPNSSIPSKDKMGKPIRNPLDDFKKW